MFAIPGPPFPKHSGGPVQWGRLTYFTVRYPETRIIFKESHSDGQFGQPKLVDKLLDSKTDGYFLDIGANHPITNNNTAFFEMKRRFRGWAFDPLNRYLELWSEIRPQTTMIHCALGNKHGKVLFHEVSGDDGWEDQLSYVENLDETALDPESVSRSTDVSVVEMRPLRDFQLPGIDFASIDVEGFEEKVIMGMLPEIKPKVLLVENCSFPVGSERLRKMIISHGYRFHSRIRYIDDLYLREDRE